MCIICAPVDHLGRSVAGSHFVQGEGEEEHVSAYHVVLLFVFVYSFALLSICECWLPRWCRGRVARALVYPRGVVAVGPNAFISTWHQKLLVLDWLFGILAEVCVSFCHPRRERRSHGQGQENCRCILTRVLVAVLHDRVRFCF